MTRGTYIHTSLSDSVTDLWAGCQAEVQNIFVPEVRLAKKCSRPNFGGAYNVSTHQCVLESIFVGANIPVGGNIASNLDLMIAATYT